MKIKKIAGMRIKYVDSLSEGIRLEDGGGIWWDVRMFFD